MTLWILIASFATSMALLFIAVFFFGRAKSAKRSVLLLSRVSLVDAEVADDALLGGVKPTRLAKSARWQKVLHDVPFTDELADILEQSGKSTTVADILAQMGIFFVLMLVLGSMLGLTAPAAMFVGFLGAVTPLFLVLHERAQRAAAFEAQLPHALELISLYLRSGRSLPQAFIAATDELMPPASEEFAMCAEEYRLGRPLDSSLKRLSMKYPDALGFRLFSIAVSVLGQTGGNLVEVLERIKKTLDASVTYALRLKSLTGETRTSALILSALPGLFMAASALLNPEYFNTFFDNAAGLILFATFMTLWGSGLVWIRIMMKSKA
ncbi:MAG TPA: type II secretion system F family protein [Myxococcota bacterium]|nr:type II secretion system F family protein [Myxococcota bacterium]